MIPAFEQAPLLEPTNINQTASISIEERRNERCSPSPAF
jgi:hypothetical protein